MLDRDDVRELTAEEGLGDASEAILAAVRAGYRLEALDAASTSAPGADRIGGDPDLAAGEQWPVSREGWPMVFLAQINCSVLAPLPVGALAAAVGELLGPVRCELATPTPAMRRRWGRSAGAAPESFRRIRRFYLVLYVLSLADRAFAREIALAREFSSPGPTFAPLGAS
jgi:Domain of unknown function (DUF1963)